MRVVMVLDCLQPGRLAQFWAEALGYRRAPSGGPYVVLVPDAQPGPELVLQRVPEPKTGKNRMHLDLRVPELQPELARLTALGAEVLTPSRSTRTASAGSCWLTRRATSSASAPNPSRIRDRTYVLEH
jgi:Glyoxalase-like domain